MANRVANAERIARRHLHCRPDNYDPSAWCHSPGKRPRGATRGNAGHMRPMIFIDGGGPGGGVVDRLRQLQHSVFDVQFGGKADHSHIGQDGAIVYANKRAEMWGAMRAWLAGGMIPDDRELLADLTGVEYGYVLREGRDAVILEKKEDMKKRGLASPDLADALALTFAYPVAATDHRWQLTGKPRHQHEYNPFQQAWAGRL